MRYPQEVHDFIREHVEGRTTKELAELVNREFGTEFTASKMKSYKTNKHLKSGTPCGLPKGRPTELYPEEVQKFIRENCDGTSPQEMVKLLRAAFGREYQESQIRGYYKNNKLKSGIVKRFQPGHESHNKGKKGLKIPGSEKGWFRKGEDPWNTVEIGTIRKKDGGYLWKKIDDKPGPWTQNWKQLHILVWEAANGPVKEGHRIIFKDGNKENCALENLAEVSLAENGVLNKKGLRFSNPEHTETGILIAKIICEGKRREKKP